MSDTRTMFGFRFCAAFIVAAVFLFFWNTIARAQDAAGDAGEIVFDEEILSNEESVATDEESGAEHDNGFWGTIGDFFGGIKEAAVGVYDSATDFLGFGDEEEAPTEEPEASAAPLPVTVAVPEDTDVEAPAAAPKTNAFTLRVAIAARDVAAALSAGRSADVIRYEPRSFEIPERGRLTLRASQDGPLFCLAFDLSEFRVAAALSDALFEVGGVAGAVEPSSAEAPAGKEGVNTACVGLPALSANAPLVIQGEFE